MSETTFLEEASRLLGPRGLTTDPDLLAPWLSDWRGIYTGKALALASPADVDETSALVKLCARHDIAIVPQGGNSGMVGGATPDQDGHSILLSLRRMNAIRSLEPDQKQIVCEAGVVLQNLHEAAEQVGLRFPLTLGGKGSATVGGLVSTNAGGTQVLRHGVMRAQVLGIEAVLANGSKFDSLVPLKKDNRGFDLKQMLIGSEGTLGIITAATLRLLPAMAGRCVLWAGVNSIHEARALLVHCERGAGQALEGFEVMPAQSLDAALRYLPGSRAPLEGQHAWHALIELVASNADEASRLHDLGAMMLEEALESGLIEDATIAANESQAEAFWLLRESLAPAEKAVGPAVQHDISVAVEKMPAFVEEAIASVERKFPNTKAIAFGHLGDGNVHFHVLAPEGAIPGEWQQTQGKLISGFVYELVTRWSGSISAEHGIGQAKLEEFGRLGDPVALQMIRAVKHALDPQGILNPGKLVPLAPSATTA